ncbi:MAG TPA: type I restriction-modification enzyme R subunit C-terminal domain-containing protein [Flavobacteriales bacterium]|nr:type I restriction-modification enzyme R subunit C-terminal domain-containing protein [Flavobacteriales bacterium]
MSLTPEQQARERIDQMLLASGWTVQDKKALNPSASLGVAVREYDTDVGPADYILFVDRVPVGVVEAKKPEEAEKFTVHEAQAEGYATAKLRWTIGQHTLPFCYLSTGEITKHWDLRDPKPRAREVFSFHRPETLQDWLKQDSLRSRLTQFPPLDPTHLRECQISAIANLEKSLSQNRPKALVQMATGSGKTFTAITSAYRLLKPPVRMRRILFLVDTKNLGEQAEQEFQSYTPNDDKRKFTELYSVQRLASSYIDPGAQVCISTIQRMYSILQGVDMDASADEAPAADVARAMAAGGVGATHASPAPAPVAYNPTIPPEFFDLIIIDECHRSIYNLWRQVLEYFDAYLVGLTATPDNRTKAFFNENVVSEYTHEQAVADGVNVGHDAYLIETRITRQGETIKAQQYIDKRDRLTRAKRWEQADEDITYTGTQLDRDVVNPSQIRTVIKAFKKAIETEIYPERREVPKTLIFAKTDSHADDIIQIVREEYGEGNEFCKKITYSTEEDPKSLLARFRNDYHPRIAVTVDMIATGTDVRPLEVLLFMRDVKSRNYFEQMKGRGTRILDADSLRKVTPSATTAKTHFVIVDAVGVTQSCKTDSRPLERKPGVSLKDLMMQVVMGQRDEDTLTSLANRLTRLEKQISPKEKEAFKEKAAGRSIQGVVKELLDAHDPDVVAATAASAPGVDLPKAATLVFDDSGFRDYVDNVRKKYEQLIDVVNTDEVTYAGFDAQAKEKAEETVKQFRQFLSSQRDTLTALRIYYSQPYRRKELTFRMVQEVAEALQQPPFNLTHERVWAAYERAMNLKTEGSQQRLLTDLVALIRFELGVDTELRPYADTVRKNFQEWVFRKQAGNVKFTEAQMAWLRGLRDFIAESVHLDRDDLELGTLGQQGGLAKMYQLFGADMDKVIEELNETLAA